MKERILLYTPCVAGIISMLIVERVPDSMISGTVAFLPKLVLCAIALILPVVIHVAGEKMLSVGMELLINITIASLPIISFVASPSIITIYVVAGIPLSFILVMGYHLITSREEKEI